ncbi:MAG: hypothetical protein ABIY55_03240, partial [Kofleriaceae bacterium]
MRHALGLLAVPLVFAATVFADTPKPPPQAAPKDPAALSERTALLAPIQVDSLTLTPIVLTAAAGASTAAGGKDDALLVLDEAMAARQVKIR